MELKYLPVVFFNYKNWVVVKYEPSLYFRQLCDLSMSAHMFSPSLQSKLFPRSSSNPNECTHTRSKSTCTLIHESQRFRNKADGLHRHPKIAQQLRGFAPRPPWPSAAVIPLSYSSLLTHISQFAYLYFSF